MVDPAPQREAILTALERLLAWPEMARSPQLGRFLDYIVQRSLQGEESSIKAYSIAVDVFGRPADFDPQADPIVRVQARRLRALLGEYYNGPGSDEVVQIKLPVGRYLPEFTVVPDAADPAEVEVQSPPRRHEAFRRRLKPGWLLLLVAIIGIALLGYALVALRPSPGSEAIESPTISVVDFQDLTTDAAVRPQAVGLAIELVTDLDQFGSIDARYGGGGETATSASTIPASDYVLTGIVRPEGDLVQYSAILTDSGSGSVVWSHNLAVSGEEARRADVLDAVSQSLSLMLGSPRSPLHARARDFLASGAPLDGAVTPYLCRVLFDLYRETRQPDVARRAGECFGALPQADRQSAMVLAATANLMAEQPAPDAPGDVYQLATDRMLAAIETDPLSSFVWEQSGRLNQLKGDLQRARADFSSAVQLNPANSDALAAYARLLALSGEMAEAEAMANEAIRGSPVPPPWYMGVPALVALQEGQFEEAVASAELYATADRELGPILAIMAGQRLGDSDVVNRYLPEVLEAANFRAEGVMPRLRRRISDEDLLSAVEAALTQAGVPPTSLSGPF